MIYLDHITASPIDPVVLESMLPYLTTHFGSPLSLHRGGIEARVALRTAREQVADLIFADAGEIIFTASGTEADNLAVKGLVQANMKQGKHVVMSAIEHQAVLHAVKSLERQGFSTTKVPVGSDGMVQPEAVRQAMQEDTVLVSIILASDEIGVIQPIKEFADIAHASNALLHTDAVAAGGRIPINVRDLEVDALSLSARTMNGPPGCGALYLKSGVRLRPQIEGGVQEDGRRGGHENLPAIVGFGQAAILTDDRLPDQMSRLKGLDHKLLHNLRTDISDISLNGHSVNRIPGHLNLMIRDADSESVVLMLDAEDIAVSIGSSCTSHASKPSHVLRAIGRTPREAQSSVLVSMGYSTVEADIDRVIDVLPGLVNKIRHTAGALAGP